MGVSLRFAAKSPKRCLLIAFVLLSLAVAAGAQPSPHSALGFRPTDDKTIADWRQITDYFARLDKASDRVYVREIGKTTNGKPLIVAFISSPGNIRNLEKYRRISAKLADPRTVSSERELADLVKRGKTIVSISCSIHSTEIVASQMSMNFAYDLATASDRDTKEILDNTILLLIPSANPDGIDIVADWYRKTIGTKSEGTSPPDLYHHYAGHDNNRDWFMMNLAETRAITRLFWHEWFPQIVYDVHQQGVNASRFVLPPFYDPANPRVDPSILREVGLIGYKMAADLQANGVEGVATNSTYDTWWHGGFRSAPYYHNSIGILSEAASANLMSPVTVKEDDLKRNHNTRGLPDLLEPATNYPDPWRGGVWRPADIAAIEMTASRSLLEMAARFRTEYLRHFYEYGRQNTVRRLDEPIAFIVTAGQSNAAAVSRFLEILMWQGIEVEQMTSELHVKTLPGQRDYGELPLGSFLVFVNQPQKNNILSLFERQVYPHRLLPNGDAERPYDVAGWTLPLQMGVEYETIWQIRDLDRERPTLKRVANINQARSVMDLPATDGPFAKLPNPLRTKLRIGLYRGFTSSMDEGWTRFVFDTFQVPYRSLSNADIRGGRLDVDVLVLPADSPNAILNGLNAERYPPEIAGGIGEPGVENLKKFVSGGGKILCFDDSCELVIKRFGLPVRNVLEGLKPNEFYDPGSIVALDVDKRYPIANGIPARSAGYFSTSSAFDVTGDANVIARYGPMLSGWTLGERHRIGKAALVETSYGKGKIVLFAFRPQHRGQSWGTFPLIFNSLER